MHEEAMVRVARQALERLMSTCGILRQTTTALDFRAVGGISQSIVRISEGLPHLCKYEGIASGANVRI